MSNAFIDGSGDIEIKTSGTKRMKITDTTVEMSNPVQMQNGATNLDHYQEAAHVITYDGALTTEINITHDLTRVGRQVNMCIVTSFTFTANATSAITTKATTELPVAFRPAVELNFTVQVRNGAVGTWTFGRMQISTAGGITIYFDANIATFTSGNTVVVRNCAFSWSV